MSEHRGKDSLMKKLLSTAPVSTGHNYSQPPWATPSSSIPSPASDAGEEGCSMLSAYLNHCRTAANQFGGANQYDVILNEHSYAKFGSECLDNVNMRPTKTLFIPKTHPTTLADDAVDVVSELVPPAPPYDLSKAQKVMNECEQYVTFVRPDAAMSDEWEDSVQRTGWTAPQNILFNKVVRVLHTDRLARLAHTGTHNEPVRRRIAVDKSAQRFREIMASMSWDTKLSQWLHTVLVENLGTSYLAAYLDILQTLKIKIPSLIEKMMSTNTQLAKLAPVIMEGLNLLLKRPWDPASSCISQDKLRKLPNNPVVIIVPSGVKRFHNPSPRANLRTSHLASLGTVVTCPPSSTTMSPRLTVFGCIDLLASAVKCKISEVRSEHPGRPIILVGWRSGAALACQVAVTEPVTAVVCLGFATNTVEGHRGEPDDSILNIQCPVLFVTGENSTSARPEELEDLREKLRVQTGLLVVGSADDCLRMGKSRKHMEEVTQGMVDRCILEEIGDFLASVLMTPARGPDRSATAYHASKGSTVHVQWKRHNSTTSSVDSETSLTKRSRPGTPQFSHANKLHGMNGSMKSISTPARTPSTRGRKPGSGRKPRVSAQPVVLNPQVSAPTATNEDITVNIGAVSSFSSGPPQTVMSTTPGGQRQRPLLPANNEGGATEAGPPGQGQVQVSVMQGNKPITTRLIVANTANVGTVLQSTKTAVATAAPVRNVHPLQSSPVQQITHIPPALTEERKTPTPARMINTGNQRISGGRGTSIHVLNKPRGGGRPLGRPPNASKTPAFIKTSPAVRQPAQRGQQFNKLLTTSGANIILLSDTGTGQSKPVIVPLVSGAKIQQSTAAKRSSPPATKSSSLGKILMSKRFITTTSILQRPGGRGRQVMTQVKRGKDDGRVDEADIMKLPVIFANEGVSMGHAGDDTPLVIPIVESEGVNSPDIPYTQDGNSISFPLDLDDSLSLEDAGAAGTSLQVVVGSPIKARGRAPKSHHIYVAKPDPVGLRKVKSLAQIKRVATVDDDTQYLAPRSRGTRNALQRAC